MITEEEAGRQPGATWIFAFFVTLGCYPVLSFLARHSYPYLAPESFLLFAGVAVVSLLMAVLLPRARIAVAAAVSLLAAAIVLLIQFNLGLEGLLLLAVGLGALAWLAGARVFMVATPVLAAMLAGAMLDSGQHPDDFRGVDVAAPAADRMGPVVHIVLDGFISAGGLPDMPASRLFRDTATSFFEDYGFTVYTRAFTRYPTTGDSLYAAFNFSHDADNRFALEVLGEVKHVLRENRYFDQLTAAGYRLNIYQTAHLDFCRSHRESTSRCWNYSHPNVRTIREMRGVMRRAGVLLKTMLSQSALFSAFTAGWIHDSGVAVHDEDVLRTLQDDMLAEPNGKVFFSHLLIPHDPFVFLNDCSVAYEDDPYLSYAMIVGETGVDPEVVEYRTLRYFEQADCALTSLRGLFNEMKARGVFDRATIVLHGDHGSQVARLFPSVGNLGLLSREDYMAHYATLFAIKPPGGRFREVGDARSLASLLEMAGRQIRHPESGAGQAGSGGAEPVFVYLKDGVRLVRKDIDLFEGTK